MRKMFIPSLNKGDTIAVFNISDVPAKISEQELKMGISFFEHLGFKTHICGTSFKEKDTKKVMTEFHDLFKNPKIQGVIFSSGGVRSLQLLPNIDFNIIKSHPKFIMGCSDCTHFLQAVTHQCNIVTFHGPVIRNIVLWDKKAQTSFLDFVTQKKEIIYPLDPNTQVFNAGKATGEVFGGNDICNLAVISALKIENFKEKILFIENHSNESPEMIEYWFSWYSSLGILDQVKGVVLGGCLIKNPKVVLKNIYDTFLSHLNIPVVSVDFLKEEKNYIIPNGSEICIDTCEKRIVFSH